MTTQVLLPKIGFSMSEGTIAQWLVADGGGTLEGQPLFLLESDKSATEIEAPASGTLKIIVQPGDTRDVGTIIATIE